jgi:hypothetical protein
VIDLTQLPLPLPEPRTLAIDGAAGRLEINVPADLPVVVDARVSAGMIDIDGVTVSGVNRVAHQVLHPTAGGPILTIEVDSGFGSAAITTGATGPETPPSVPVAPFGPPNPRAPVLIPKGVR